MGNDYCGKCGNTGIIFESGERCECKRGSLSEFENESVCLSVPEQYRGVLFNSVLVQRDLGEIYPRFLETLYTDMITLKHRNKNVFVSSPAKHSKTVFAYSVIQSLFRKNMAVFPLMDVLELRHIINELDFGRKPVILQDSEVDPMNMYTTPYLFVKMPAELSYAVFETINLILGRKLRCGGEVIILSDFGWNYVSAADKRGTFTDLLGDGSFGTLENKSFYRKEGTE